MLKMAASLTALQFKRAAFGGSPKWFRPLVRDRDRPGYLAPVARRHCLVPPVRLIAISRVLMAFKRVLQQPDACFPVQSDDFDLVIVRGAYPAIAQVIGNAVMQPWNGANPGVRKGLRTTSRFEAA
jgi:hypothetical protein